MARRAQEADEGNHLVQAATYTDIVTPYDWSTYTQ